MRIKIISTVSLLFGLINGLVAQSDVKLSNYLLNPLIYNPAYAGSYQGLTVTSIYSSQWVGFEGAPQTIFLSGHKKIDDMVGLGVDVMNDRIGATNESKIIGNYAYHVNLDDEWKLSMGLKAGLSSYTIDYGLLSIYNPSEFNDVNEKITTLTPVFGAGFYLHKDGFFAGVSIPNMVPYKKIDSYRYKQVNAALSYYVTSGYKFEMDRGFVIEPTILTRLTLGSPVSIIPALNFNWNNDFYASVNYESNASIGAFLGCRVAESFTLGYAFDSSTNRFNNYNGGIHTLFLNFKLDNWCSGDVHSTFTF
jgi:type IX secretion system PorP/SprF family membrane protein